MRAETTGKEAVMLTPVTSAISVGHSTGQDDGDRLGPPETRATATGDYVSGRLCEITGINYS